jgi:hypothetical protein
MCAIFPRDVARRAFLKSVGASTALAAISQFFPIMTASEVFAEAGAPEKKDLKAGFIPITCATPIIMAAPLGFYARHGLNVEVVKTAGWAVIRDKTINKEYDAAHMLAPMPIATGGHVVQVALGDGKAIRPQSPTNTSQASRSGRHPDAIASRICARVARPSSTGLSPAEPTACVRSDECRWPVTGPCAAHPSRTCDRCGRDQAHGSDRRRR